MKNLRLKSQIIFLTVYCLLSTVYCVYASLELSTDNRAINFSQMELGEEKELTQLGGYHNEITCRSTNEKTWYLKINLLLPLTSGTNTIPLENFKWQLIYTDGKGQITNPYQFKGFTLSPDLTYISGAGDSSGTNIHLRFKYYLKIPETQAKGIYNTVIRFTLIEIL